MAPDQNKQEEKSKVTEPVLPESFPDKPIDADEIAHELPDLEPEIPADPDDLVHTFLPQPEISNSDDIDDLIHPPAVEGNEPE